MQRDPQARLARRSVHLVDHVPGDLRERNRVVVNDPHRVSGAGFGGHRLVGPFPHRVLQRAPNRGIRPGTHELAEGVDVTG